MSGVRGDRLRLFGLALGTRLLAGVGVWSWLALHDRRVLFPDEGVYLDEATAVAHGGPFTTHGYSNLVGLMFRVAGSSAWLPRFVNVLAGAVVAVAAYELVRLLAGQRTARAAGVAVALWPSLVLWSVLVLKDTLTVLAALVVLAAVARIWRGVAVAAVSGLAGLIALEGLRPYAFVVMSLALLPALVAAWRAPARRIAVTAVAAILLLSGLWGMAQGWGFLGLGFARDAADVETVAFTRNEGSTGDTGFAYRNPDDAGDVLAGLPRGLLYSMLGPFPWTATAEARPLLILELPLWLSALVLGLVGAVQVVRQRRVLFWLPTITFAAGIVAVLALYEGNAGTAMRQRAMVIPVVLALAAVAAEPWLQALELRIGKAGGGVDGVEDRDPGLEDQVQRPARVAHQDGHQVD